MTRRGNATSLFKTELKDMEEGGTPLQKPTKRRRGGTLPLLVVQTDLKDNEEGKRPSFVV